MKIERPGNRKELKISPDYFLQVCTGKKNFECRIDDRDIQIGDYVQLEEW